MVPEILREIKQVHTSCGIELKIRPMLCSHGLQHVASPRWSERASLEDPGSLPLPYVQTQFSTH